MSEEPETTQEDTTSQAQVLVPNPIDALVEAWFVEHFHNRAPAVDPDAYNIAYVAAQDLKKRLAALPITSA